MRSSRCARLPHTPMFAHDDRHAATFGFLGSLDRALQDPGGLPGHERGAEAVRPGHAVQLVRAHVRLARQLQHLLPEGRQQVRLQPSPAAWFQISCHAVFLVGEKVFHLSVLGVCLRTSFQSSMRHEKKVTETPPHVAMYMLHGL